MDVLYFCKLFSILQMAELSGKEKLEREIDELKSKIKNTEYDLAHMFKGNSFIGEKLRISNEILKEKEKLLETLESGKTKKEKLKKAEEEISDKEDSIITSEQGEIIEKEIEEEIA